MTAHHFAAGLLLLQLTAGPVPEQRHFHFDRTVRMEPGAGRQTCVTLGPEIFPHAAPSLDDLRLYSGAEEVPYALTVSASSTSTSDPAMVLNLGSRAGHIVFDLAMPLRPYTDVVLDLRAQNFLATATVSGERPGAPPTQLGVYTLFDLTAQHLSSASTLTLPESTFPSLHLDLAVTPAPGTSGTFTPAIVGGAMVPPSREDQTVFTTVAETAGLRQENRQTMAVFQIAERVPVERVAFVLAPGYKGNFSRTVRISAHAGTPGAAMEQLTGEISRVDLPGAAHDLHEERLAVPAILGANLQSPAMVEVAIDDGDDRPLGLAAVRLEMRERRLCFASPSEAPTLYYGDPALRAPAYDYARLFVPAASAGRATLDPEQPNPGYVPREDQRPLTERHPELLWLALIGVIGVLAFLAFRSARHLPR